MLRAAHAIRHKGPHVRVGFVPLIDAAPLVAASELGLFAEEQLQVSLERQIGWGNVRDKLTFGHLDASHALIGMPLASQLARRSPGAGSVGEWFAEPLVAVMALGNGGNAITLGARLCERGVNSAVSLARWIRSRQKGQGAGRESARLPAGTPPPDPRPVFAHVFSCSMHHYLLREWLAAAEISPDADVRLCVVPPAQMTRQLCAGGLDGFCAGEPWNTLAERQACGRIVAATTDIVPNHPEKVLAVSRKWFGHNAGVVEHLVRALLKACLFCQEKSNARDLAAMLAKPAYLNLPVEAVEASLTVDPSVGLGTRYKIVRPSHWLMRDFSPQGTFPSRTHFAWLLEQMMRWGHVAGDVDVAALAAGCAESGPYRSAAAATGVACPAGDFPPMPLRNGQWFKIDAPAATDAPIAPTGGLTR